MRKGAGKVRKKTKMRAFPRSSAQIAAMDDWLSMLSGEGGLRVAVFLGAGASKTFDYPITRDLMLKIFQGLRGKTILSADKGPSARGHDPRRELLDFLTALLPGERYSEETVPMVTSVLSLLDFALASGQALLPGRTLDQTRRARQLLERALLEVIPDQRGFEKDYSELFGEYLDWLASIHETCPPGGFGLVTANYDMLSDLAAMYLAGMEGEQEDWSLSDIANKVDFGFRWARPGVEKEEFFSRPQSPQMSLFKLHGSTDWLRCPLCENLYIDPRFPIAWRAAEAESNRNNQCHCGETRLEAQIVSPSFVREMREPNLIATWKSALDFLKNADRWIIIGYSFPDEDVGLRALFTRAFGAKNNRAKNPRRKRRREKKQQTKISVIQLDEKAKLNYLSFFPQGSVQYLTGGLGLLLDRWKRSEL